MKKDNYLRLEATFGDETFTSDKLTIQHSQDKRVFRCNSANEISNYKDLNDFILATAALAEHIFEVGFDTLSIISISGTDDTFIWSINISNIQIGKDISYDMEIVDWKKDGLTFKYAE